MRVHSKDLAITNEMRTIACSYGSEKVPLTLTSSLRSLGMWFSRVAERLRASLHLVCRASSHEGDARHAIVCRGEEGCRANAAVPSCMIGAKPINHLTSSRCCMRGMGSSIQRRGRCDENHCPSAQRSAIHALCRPLLRFCHFGGRFLQLSRSLWPRHRCSVDFLGRSPAV